MEVFQERLVQELGTETVFTIPVLGGIPVTESVVVTWIVMAIWMVLTLLLTRRLSVCNPGKIQIVLESAVEFFSVCILICLTD